MKTYQIKESYGEGSYCCLYLDVNDDTPIDKIKTKIIEMVKRDYYNECNNGMHFSTPDKPRPTLYVKEYDREKNKCISLSEFKVKWR